jgi:hypothetical protein
VTTAEDRIVAVRALITDETPVGRGPGGMVGWLQRLCAAAVRGLPVSGAGVTVMAEDGARGLAAASDPVSEALEELQFTLGEGPCIDAFSSRRPVLEPDLVHGAMSRWPAYSPAALDRGVRAAFAFPLQVGAARLGVLDVHRIEPGSLSGEALAQALTFAEVAVQTLLDGQDRAPHGQSAEGLEQALAYRFALYQAQGMTMIDLGVSIGEAMARLRAHAYAHGRPLSDIARDVVEGRLRLESDSR